MPKEIDHIDRNKLNNKIENLREVTKSENMANRKKHKTNKSGYKGVAYHKASKKWRASVRINKKDVWIGCYKTPELAYFHYCEFVKANLPIHCLE